MELLTPELGLFVWTLIAFLLVLFILKKFAWVPILQSLNDREKEITESISAAEKVKKEMSQLLADNEKIMVATREERTNILKEAKEIKERIIGEAKEQAKLDANKIMMEAQQQIEQQKNAALTEVKNEIGRLAIDVAEKILKKQLSTPEGQTDYMNLLTDEINMN